VNVPYPVSREHLDAAEARLGRRLPLDLRARLSRDNGGEVKVGDEVWWLHPVWDPTDRKTMRKTASHIVAETASAREWPGFPEGAIAIANNGGGDLLIVRAGSDEIELWDHETGELDPVEDLVW
jgi:hypothetical protein